MGAAFNNGIEIRIQGADFTWPAHCVALILLRLLKYETESQKYACGACVCVCVTYMHMYNAYVYVYEYTSVSSVSCG